MKLVLLGKPGSGKGSEAELLIKKFKFCYIAMGNILREIERKKTRLGKLVKSHIDKGELVPNEITIRVLKERLSRTDCRNNFLLDGFPRDIEQAKELEGISKIDKVVYLDVPDSLIVKRLSSRRNCTCGAVYNLITNPPKKSGICNNCGRKLFIRPDDNPKSIKNRLNVYNKMTKPVINLYSRKKLLVKVDGSGTIKGVYKAILKKLGKAA
jgi:adenylate kinase